MQTVIVTRQHLAPGESGARPRRGKGGIAPTSRTEPQENLAAVPGEEACSRCRPRCASNDWATVAAQGLRGGEESLPGAMLGEGDMTGPVPGTWREYAAEADTGAAGTREWGWADPAMAIYLRCKFGSIRVQSSRAMLTCLIAHTQLPSRP
jgi:hypothetical protein